LRRTRLSPAYPSVRPPAPAHQHVVLPAPAPRACQPLAPIENGGPCAMSPGLLGGVGLDLVPVRLAPRSAEPGPRPGRRASLVGRALGFHSSKKAWKCRVTEGLATRASFQSGWTSKTAFRTDSIIPSAIHPWPPGKPLS